METGGSKSEMNNKIALWNTATNDNVWIPHHNAKKQAVYVTCIVEGGRGAELQHTGHIWNPRLGMIIYERILRAQHKHLHISQLMWIDMHVCSDHFVREPWEPNPTQYTAHASPHTFGCV